MAEAFLMNHKRKTEDTSKFYDNYTNIGNKATMDGATHNGAGYFGTVLASQIFTGSEIASAVGITEGTVQHNEIEWLKYYIDGKIIFRPLKSIRYGISWDAINTAGCAFGEKTVTKNGVTFKVRLMKGSTTDPAIVIRDNINTMKYSEWNRLILPTITGSSIWNNDVYVAESLPSWGAGYTAADLVLTTSGNGRNHWCQETTSDSSAKRLARGVTSAYQATTSASTTKTAYFGWTPLLEVVPPTE